MELLEIAKDNAFTEPDPREDLSGNDVIRKIRILARDAGFIGASEDFDPAIDRSFLGGDLSDFWKKSDAINNYYLEKYQKAKQQDGVLRYIATLTKKTLKLRLQVVDKEHAFC